MIIMPHSRPGHRCSSQAKQTSGTPQAIADAVIARDASLARHRMSRHLEAVSPWLRDSGAVGTAARESRSRHWRGTAT